MNVASTIKPKQQVFTRATPVHMYANKETSMGNMFNPERREITRERMKLTLKRVWSDTGARYYFGFSLIAVFLAAEYLLFEQNRIFEEAGLAGPKRKKYHSRLTVVLDVDETLISFGDKAFRLKGSVVPRPHLAELLDYLAKIDAEVILWSGGSDRYMKAVLMAIDPAGLRVSHYLTREGSWFVNDRYYEKNIKWLNRPMEDTLIIENRPMSIRSCNENAVLVDDFIRAEYMDTGRDYPANDKALKTIKEIVKDLHEGGMPVAEYLAATAKRHKDIKTIPCHLALRQMPDELAKGEFYFVGEKFVPTEMGEREFVGNIKKAPK